MPVFVHGYRRDVVVAPFPADEDKRPERHSAPVAVVNGQNCAVVKLMLAVSVFQEKQKPQKRLDYAPSKLNYPIKKITDILHFFLVNILT